MRLGVVPQFDLVQSGYVTDGEDVTEFGIVELESGFDDDSLVGRDQRWVRAFHDGGIGLVSISDHEEIGCGTEEAVVSGWFLFVPR